MEMSEFVIETTVYEITCSNCSAHTDEMDCEENAVSDAESMGFQVIGDSVYCDDCAAKQ